MNGPIGSVQVSGDHFPDVVLVESGRGTVRWDGPVKVLLYRMSPAHMRNLAVLLEQLAVQADQEVAA